MEDKTPALKLKKMAVKLMTALLKSKTGTNIGFNNKVGSMNFTVDISFFKNGDCFSITLYPFWTIGKNEELLDLALTLMRDESKYLEIKEKVYSKVYS